MYCVLVGVLYRIIACVKFKWLVKFAFDIPKIVVQKQSYASPFYVDKYLILDYVWNKQAIQVYFVFRWLLKCCLQRKMSDYS